MTEDDTCQNSYYARLGGVDNDEMMRLELDFLELIKFNVFVSEQEFNTYEEDLKKFYNSQDN